MKKLLLLLPFFCWAGCQTNMGTNPYGEFGFSFDPNLPLPAVELITNQTRPAVSVPEAALVVVHTNTSQHEPETGVVTFYEAVPAPRSTNAIQPMVIIPRPSVREPAGMAVPSIPSQPQASQPPAVPPQQPVVPLIGSDVVFVPTNTTVLTNTNTVMITNTNGMLITNPLAQALTNRQQIPRATNTLVGQPPGTAFRTNFGIGEPPGTQLRSNFGVGEPSGTQFNPPTISEPAGAPATNANSFATNFPTGGTTNLVPPPVQPMRPTQPGPEMQQVPPPGQRDQIIQPVLPGAMPIPQQPRPGVAPRTGVRNGMPQTAPFGIQPAQPSAPPAPAKP